MKNKKYFYGLLVLVLLLCAGIGFAAVTSTLTINGTASTADDTALAEKNLNVYFSDKKDYETDANGVAAVTSIVGADKINAEISATGFSTTTSQIAKVVFEISNLSNQYDVTVGASIKYEEFGEGTYGDYFLVKYYFVSADDITAAYSLTSDATTIGIKNNKKAYIVLEVSLIKLPTSQLTGAEFTVTLTANATYIQDSE